MGNRGSSPNGDAGGGGSGRRGRRQRNDPEDAELSDRRGGGGGGSGGDGRRDGGDGDGDGKRNRRAKGRKPADADGDSEPDSDDDVERDAKKQDDAKDAKRYRSNMSVLDEKELADAKRAADANGSVDDGAGDVKGWDVDQILKTQRDRKKRDDENKRELQRRFDKKRYPFYGEENSPEKAIGGWSVAKLVVYVIVAGLGIYLAEQGTDLKLCRPNGSSTECLQDGCVAVGEVVNGAICCQFRESNGLGCNFTAAAPTVPNCVSSVTDRTWWQENCIATDTCPLSVLDTGRKPAVAVAAVWLIAAVHEAVVAAALFQFATTHTSEFAELDRGPACLACWYKASARVSQLLLAVMIGVELYLISAFGSSSRTQCANAVDSTGKRVDYVSQLTWYVIVSVAWLVVATVIGTVVRNKYRVRGELAEVQDVDSLTVPGNLDCATCRALDRPRLCHDEVRGCTNPPDDEDSLYHKVPCAAAWGCCCGLLCDGIFCCFCFPCGYCMEHCCRARATIAP